MNTVALEIVPPAWRRPGFSPEGEACRVHALLEDAGLAERVNTILVPQLVAEDEDRPVLLESRMDPVEVLRAYSPHIKASYVPTQVTVHTAVEDLSQRVAALRMAGAQRIVFVGAPRNNSRPLPGPSPEAALGMFAGVVPSKGVILIPTRAGERERFLRKVQAGADFAVTQLLFSNHVVSFLRELQREPYRPEVLLSFGHVPRVEQERGLLRWLIRDTSSPLVSEEYTRIIELAGMPPGKRKAAQVAHYVDTVHAAATLGFPLGIHFEAPYGVTAQALETFRAMLDAWSPGKP